MSLLLFIAGVFMVSMIMTLMYKLSDMDLQKLWDYRFYLLIEYSGGRLAIWGVLRVDQDQFLFSCMISFNLK